MNLAKLQTIAQNYWARYQKIFPELASYPCPKVSINNRYTKTGACNRTEDNEVVLAGKFLAKFPDNMINVILPHELAHQIDYNLNGWHFRKLHHGAKWVEIMVKIGQPPEPYHEMVL